MSTKMTAVVGEVYCIYYALRESNKAARDEYKLYGYPNKHLEITYEKIVVCGTIVEEKRNGPSKTTQ